MSTAELCRLCVNEADQTHVEKLFERNRRKLLAQIEELMGQRLKNAKDLPQHICKSCEERTLQAHAFRAQCIRAQQHFATQKKECSPQRKIRMKETVPPIEEVVLNEIETVKEENVKKEEEDAISQLSLIAEVLFKHEPIMSDEDFIAGNDSDVLSYNPLDEEQNHQHQCTDEVEDKNDQTFEPKISLPNKSKLKPLKKEKSNPKMKMKRNKIIKQEPNFTKEKNFICDQCGRHFVCNSMLDTHMRRHTGERKFKCEICPESFFLNSDLKRHILKHAGILPYPCSHCERRFLDKSHAKKHERTHTNERPFVCQQCGKAFTVSHILHDHMVTHTGERAFSCKMCNVAFKRKTHLKTHYRSMTHKQNEEKYQQNMNN